MAADAYRFSVMLTRLRRSILPSDLYKALVAHVKDFLGDDSSVIPYVFEEWRRLIIRSELSGDLDFPDRIPILNNFAAYGIRNPSDLAQFSRSDIAVLILDDLTAPAIWKLWRAAAMSSDLSDGTLMTRNLALCPYARDMASAFRAKEIGDTSFARNRKAARVDLGLSDEYESAGPAARIRLLELSRAPPATLSAFLNTGAQINTLRQVQGSLRSVASGAQ